MWERGKVARYIDGFVLDHIHKLSLFTSSVYSVAVHWDNPIEIELSKNIIGSVIPLPVNAVSKMLTCMRTIIFMVAIALCLLYSVVLTFFLISSSFSPYALEMLIARMPIL